MVAIAVGDALLSLGERWWSARIGEGLIFDLRVALFDHVQRMPIAFFTRTQTGALISRMNNDVIGAQRASPARSASVVSNIVDARAPRSSPCSCSSGGSRCSRSILLPLFIIPAKRVGRRLQAITREGDGPQRRDEHAR